ncbi:hypothetical protein BH24CHL4_BH24CHL4_06800 [soil metagenome]
MFKSELSGGEFLSARTARKERKAFCQFSNRYDTQEELLGVELFYAGFDLRRTLSSLKLRYDTGVQ